jgi:hypothetical protein
MVDLGVNYLMVDIGGTWFTAIITESKTGYVAYFILDGYTLVNSPTMASAIDMIENFSDVDTHNLVVLGEVISIYHYLMDNVFQLGQKVSTIKILNMYISVGWNITEMTYYSSRKSTTAWYLQKGDHSIEVSVNAMMHLSRQSEKKNGSPNWWGYGWAMRVHKRDHLGRATITKYTQSK